jgi:hypothetical protein
VPRTVTLVLVDGSGAVLGALPPYDVPAPWWQDAAEVVTCARERHGVEATVLRLLHAERPGPPGGAVCYLAEVAGAPAGRNGLREASVDLSPHPARAPWAMPGGPGRSLAWAARALAERGREAARPVQQRTWNLSAIWRLDPTEGGPPAGWLKQVPWFFAHEAAVLGWLGEEFPGLAPGLLAAGGDGLLLLDHVPGEDWYGVDPAGRGLIAADMHAVQVRAAGCAEKLVAAGVPDRRGHRLAELIRTTLAGHGADLGPVAGPLQDLDRRLAAAAGCGLPDTLVHGDLHPGNTRVAGGRRVILDWGDSFVGHPVFDIIRLTEDLPGAEAAAARQSWADRWRASVPGCDPERALGLLAPMVTLWNAAVYARFLAEIEPSERPYHAGDVPVWLDRAGAHAKAGPATAG